LPIAPVENARGRLGEVRYPQRAMDHRVIRKRVGCRALITGDPRHIPIC
jgi:hypothetical protein